MSVVPGRVATRIAELGLTLPPPPEANGRYVTWRIDGNRLSTSGQLSRAPQGILRGPAEGPEDIDRGKDAARVCVLRALSVAQAALGSLDLLEGVSAIRGYVFAGPVFTAHSRVLDGASELITDIFGVEGRHIRTAVGVSGLPDGGLVEIEVEFRIGGAAHLSLEAM
jgi:enamine deaminase RidA (YjgF/YER057c/UK114 family)